MRILALGDVQTQIKKCSNNFSSLDCFSCDLLIFEWVFFFQVQSRIHEEGAVLRIAKVWGRKFYCGCEINYMSPLVGVSIRYYTLRADPSTIQRNQFAAFSFFVYL